MCASAKGSLVFLMPVSSKFQFVPASVTLFVTGFTFICKLDPSLEGSAWSIWKCQLLPPSWWRNPAVFWWGTKAWYWHWGQTALAWELHVDISSNITCSPLLRTKNQFGEQWRARTAITQIMWARPETGECIGAQYLVMMVSRVNYTEITLRIKYVKRVESCQSVHIITSLHRQYR